MGTIISARVEELLRPKRPAHAREHAESYTTLCAASGEGFESKRTTCLPNEASGKEQRKTTWTRENACGPTGRLP